MGKQKAHTHLINSTEKSRTDTIRQAKPRPDRLFFPAACLLGLLSTALKAASYAGIIDLSVLPLYWHGHEMLLGFASALMGGYLLSSSHKARIRLVFGAWLVGRAAIFVPAIPFSLQAPMLLLYPLLLALYAGGPFVRAAKSWRNLIFPAILGALVLAEFLYLLGHAIPLPLGPLSGIILAAGMVLAMLFTMGGRLIAAATSGAHQAIGRKLHRPAHQDLERAGLFILAPMVALDILDLYSFIGGFLALAFAVVITLRLWRWQIWHVARQWSVSALHVGYIWLAFGLFLKGWAQLSGQLSITEALHPAFVGGLGMLCMTVMARTRLQRDRQPVLLGKVLAFALVLITLSACARMLSYVPALRIDALWATAGLWCTGFGLLVLWLVYLVRGNTSKGPKPIAKSR